MGASISRILLDAICPFLGDRLAAAPDALVADSLRLLRTQRFEDASDVACAPSRRRVAVGAAPVAQQHRDSHFFPLYPVAAVPATVHESVYAPACAKALEWPPRLPNASSGRALLRS